MESGSIINSSSFSYNDVINGTHNHTQQFSWPPWTITAITICSVGILANSFTIIVIIFSSLKTSVFMNLLMILGIFDILFLMTVIDVQPGLFGQLIDPTEVYCSLNNYFRYVCGVVSSWVTVFLTLERFIVIHFPLNVYKYCTIKRTSKTVIALTILSCFCLVPSLYVSTLEFSDEGPIYTINWNGNLQMIFMFLLVFCYSIVPSLFIVLLNILMMRKLKMQESFRLSSLQHSKTLKNTSNVIMVCICSIFVSASIPATIVVFAYYSAGCSISFPRWLFYFTYLLDDINHSVNFFLYCLTGSVFREALFQVLGCKKKQSSKGHLQQQVATIENVI